MGGKKMRNDANDLSDDALAQRRARLAFDSHATAYFSPLMFRRRPPY